MISISSSIEKHFNQIQTIEELKAQIRNEIIDQDLRDSISLETRDIRTLILANAFSNTGLIDRE